MFGFHWAELVIVLVLVMVFFGPKRLPELGGALGKGLRDFRHGLHEAKDELGIAEIQDSMRDIKDTVAGLPQEVNSSMTETPEAHAAAGKTEAAG